ncbi:MAG: hypothetical protein OEQ29_13465 [Alphaproteobacteria bacterium]|nr:hypothetical protein [Alphaproteobacteria bacterium]
MKKTLIALAAAATVSLGTIGAASAAPVAALDVTAANGAAVQKVGHGHFHHRRHYYGYNYGYSARRYCTRLYYKGYVLGFAWARFKYVRHCAWRYGY